MFQSKWIKEWEREIIGQLSKYTFVSWNFTFGFFLYFYIIVYLYSFPINRLHLKMVQWYITNCVASTNERVKSMDVNEPTQKPIDVNTSGQLISTKSQSCFALYHFLGGSFPLLHSNGNFNSTETKIVKVSLCMYGTIFKNIKLQFPKKTGMPG